MQAAAAPATAGKPAPAPAASGGGALAGVRLDDIRLDNGKLSYVDDRSGEKTELDQVNLKLSLPDLDSPMKADGSLVYRGEKLALSVSLANPRAFMDAKSSAAELKLDFKPVVFDFKGNAAGSTPVKLDGAVDLKIPSVRGLAQWAGTPLARPGTGFGPLALAGKVSVAGAKIGFSDATLSLEPSRPRARSPSTLPAPGHRSKASSMSTRSTSIRTCRRRPGQGRQAPAATGAISRSTSPG